MPGIGVGIGPGFGSGGGAGRASRLAAARAAVLADAPTLLLYSDIGLTPAAPALGDDVTAWADQSGGAHHVTFASGNRPEYRLDGSWPYLDCLAADQCLGATNLTLATGAKGFRWTLEKTAAATASVEIIAYRGSQWYLLLHCVGTGIGAGTHLALQTDAGGFVDLGACPAGKHDFELVFDGTNATLYIDGVSGTPTAYTDTSVYPGETLAILGFNGSTWSTDAHIYGFSYFAGAATADARAHWITMSQIAWGPHD